MGRRGVGMDVEPAARTVVFEGPGLGESVLFEDAGKFQPSLFGAIVFSGEGKSPGTCWIDTVRLVQSPDEPTTAKADIGRPRTRQRPR